MLKFTNKMCAEFLKNDKFFIKCITLVFIPTHYQWLKHIIGVDTSP